MKRSFRQVFIIIGLFTSSISEGFVFGQMSGMVTFMKTDTDLNLSENEISWIASTISVTCVIGFAVAGIITELIGRRHAMVTLSLPFIANWLLVYYAQDFMSFMLSRIIIGISCGGHMILVSISTSEYTSPDMRCLYLNIMWNVGPTIGAALSRILCIMLHWRTVALLALIPAIISSIIPLFWVESPSWLASKGKYEECRKSFNYLHGHRGEAARKELDLLIECEKIKNTHKSSKSRSMMDAFRSIKLAMQQWYFWKLTVLVMFIQLYRVAGGKYQYNTLAIDMIQDIVGQSEVLYYTMFVDMFFVTGSIISCFLIIKMKMLPLLFSTGTISTIILLILSICLYFQPSNSLYFPWINAALLALYLVLINSGPYPVVETAFGEIFPLEIRCFCIFFFAALSGVAFFFAIKLLVPMKLMIGYYGIFLVSILLITISLVYLWFHLMETKGRTLHEIELFVKTGSYKPQEQELCSEQNDGLI